MIESGNRSQPASEVKDDKKHPPSPSTPVETNTQSHCSQVAQSPRTAKARAIASLIWKKALVHSYLNGLAVTSLLDSGSQVSIVSRAWKDEYLPDLSIRPVSEILGEEDLNVIAANGSLIPYDGWISIIVNLPGNLDPNLSISVPFLISSYPMDRPLNGFNVLEVLICDQPERLMPVLVSLLSNTISVPNETAEALVSFIQTAKPAVQQGRIRTGVKDTVLPAGQVSWVKCRVPANINTSSRLVLFETDEDSLLSGQWEVGPGLFEIQDPAKPYITIPIGNNTNHDITIPRKTALGILQHVDSIVETDIPDESQPGATVSEVTTTQTSSLDPPLWHPRIHL